MKRLRLRLVWIIRLIFSISLQIQDLQAEVMRLSDLVSASNEELESLKTEFNGYKLRAQSVLRTRANQVGVGRSIAEVEEELQQTRHQLNAQREKCDAYRYIPYFLPTLCFMYYC